jgi:phenylpropionate dioxygenase-like ring-hydroxylating dioxygenase large terminal subunit
VRAIPVVHMSVGIVLLWPLVWENNLNSLGHGSVIHGFYMGFDVSVQ